MIVTLGATAAQAVTPTVSVSSASVGRDAANNLTWDVTATTGNVQGTGQICPNSANSCTFYLYGQLENGNTEELQRSTIAWGTTFPYSKHFVAASIDSLKVIAVRAYVQGQSGTVYSPWVAVSDPLIPSGVSLSITSIGRDATSNLTWDVTATAEDSQGVGQVCRFAQSSCTFFLQAQLVDGGTTELQRWAIPWGSSFPYSKQFIGNVDMLKVTAVRAYVDGAEGRLLYGEWTPIADPATNPAVSLVANSIGRDASSKLTWDVSATAGDVQGAGQVCPTSSGSCTFFLNAQLEDGRTTELQRSSIAWGTTFPLVKPFASSIAIDKVIAIKTYVQGPGGTLTSDWLAIADPLATAPVLGTVSTTIQSIGRDASTGQLTFDLSATTTDAFVSGGPCKHFFACTLTVQSRSPNGDIHNLPSTDVPFQPSYTKSFNGMLSQPAIVDIRSYIRGTAGLVYGPWVPVSDPYPSRSVAISSASIGRDPATGNLTYNVAVSVHGALLADGSCGGSWYHCTIKVQTIDAAGSIGNLTTSDLQTGSPTQSDFVRPITGASPRTQIVAIRAITSGYYAPGPFYSDWFQVTDPYPERSVAVTGASITRDPATGKLSYRVSALVRGASLLDGPCGGTSYHCTLYVQAKTVAGGISTITTASLQALMSQSPPLTGLSTQDKIVAIRAYTMGDNAPGPFYSDWVPVHDRDMLETAGGGNSAEKGCTCSNADPVNTETGEFYETEADLGLPGIGPDVAVTRTYSSLAASNNSAFGYGWTSNFGSRLVIDVDGDSLEPLPLQVHIVQENGATVPFSRASDRSYPSAPWVLATLSHSDADNTWTFTRDNRDTFVFDSDGSLISRSDLHGNTVTYGYTSGKVTSIAGSGGREISLTWTSGRVTSVADSASRSVTYTYDSPGNLKSVEAADGNVWQYTYDSSHRMLTQTSPGGGTTANVYNTVGQVLSQADPIGRVTTFAYSAFTTAVTHPDGSITTYVFDEGQPESVTAATGTTLAATVSYSYDSEGNLASTTDPLGHVTASTFDADGNALTTTDPLDRTTTRTFDDLRNITSIEEPLGHTTQMTYNSKGDLTSLTSPEGHTSTWIVNPDGTIATHTDARNKTSFTTYDTAGRPLCTTDPDNREACVEYDDRGFVVTSTDPAGAATTYTHDAVGRVLTATDPEHAETTTTYDEDGNPLTVEDAEGNVTTLTYDLADQLVTKENPIGGVTSYTYSPRGEVASVTNPNGDVSTTSYDASNRVSAVTDGESRTTTFVYDLTGRLLTTTLPSTSVTTNSYDDAGQLVTTTNALGNVTLYDYDDGAQLVATTDPLNRITASSYTEDGLLDTVTYPDGSTEAHDYNANGQETSFVNADGAESTYTYSGSGLLASKTEPGGLDTQYTYDAAGRLDEITTPDGHTSSRTYDDAGHLLSLNYPGADDDVDFTYDDLGQRLTMDDATGVTTYAYTDNGQLASVENGAGRAIGYTYDSAGLLTTLSYPGGHDVEYTYNDAGQMTSVTGWASGTTGYGYTADGYLQTRVDPNGVTETRTYDAAGHLLDIVDVTSAATLARYSYGFDDAGQLASTTSTDALHAGVVENWGYDPRGQLTSTSPTTTYDATPAGQLTATPSGDSLQYNPAGQLIEMSNATTGVVTSYEYDGNGARTETTTDNPTAPDTTMTFGYSEGGALNAVTSGITNISYGIDGDGLRQSRTENSVTRESLWDVGGAMPLLLGDEAHTYVYGAGIAPILQLDAAGTPEYLYGDNIGSIRVEASSEGDLVSTTDYDEFGRVITHVGTSDMPAVGYSGAWTDDSTNLIYLRARDYDPRSSQFIEVDPIVSTTRQAYAYVSNNPLNAVDPTGTRYCPASGGPCYEDELPILSAEEQLLSDWSTGQLPWTQPYDLTDPLAQDLRNSSRTEGAVSQLQAGLSSGLYGAGSFVDAGYQAGDPFIVIGGTGPYEQSRVVPSANFSRDMRTYTAMYARGEVSIDDQLMAALGSYDMTARVESYSRQCRTAEISFYGTNSITLGSALSWAPFARPAYNWLGDATGVLHQVDQTFSWRETIAF
jgi:RHS repeat-associated protein